MFMNDKIIAKDDKYGDDEDYILTGLEEGQVSTVKIEGSQWSKLTLLMTQ